MSRSRPSSTPSSTRPLHLALILAAGLALPLAAAAQPAGQNADRRTSERPSAAPAAPGRPASEDLPLRRITLYRSGVGFFHRDGMISGSTDLQLRFRTEQINDILKSMVLLDLDGGQIGGVSYGSKDPLSRRLASFGVNIADNPSVPDLLARLRGSEVSLVTVNGEITGTILGVETRPTVVPSNGSTSPPAVVNQPHLSLVTSGGIRTIPISEISSFTLTDKDLAAELNKALAALAEYRAETNKTVNISLSGPENKARRIVAAYVHEMPIWKTSYRLILPESDEGGSDSTGGATMQGWAIVENTTDEDWRDVRLSLVAGRPVSFEMDLYEPLYLDRPDLPVPVVAGVMPRQYQAGTDAQLGQMVAGKAAESRERTRMQARGLPAPAAPAMEGAAMMDRGAGGGESAFGAISAGEMAGYAAQAQAQAGTVGEVFQYELVNPITVERQQSAMLPFLTAEIPARRVSIFNLSDGSDHPMRGVEITNPAKGAGDGGGLQLLPGPIAVFDGAAYAGDASIGHIPAGDKRLLAYAVDLDVAALTRPEQTNSITRLRIVDGALEQTMKLRSTTTYGFENKDDARGRTILIEHPRLPGWDLIAPKPEDAEVEGANGKEAEQTRDFYRFEMELPPGGSDALPVVQERTERQTIAVLSYDLPTILAYHREGKASDKVLEVFREVATRQSAINDTQRAIAEIDREVNEINQDQSRIRSNMNSIDRNSDLYRRYMTKLTDQEARLETLHTQRAEAVDQLERQQAELNAFLRDLDVE